MIETEEQKIISALEVELGVSNQATRKPLSRKQLNRAVDIVLKKWGFIHRRTNGREAERDTGNYGSPGKRKGIDAIYEMDDAQFDHVQSVLIVMPETARRFIFMHYLRRPRLIDELQMKHQIKSNETTKDYNRRLENLYFDMVDYAKSTYGRHLYEAKYEFMARGGLL